MYEYFYFELARDMARAYAAMIPKNTGCPACDELPGSEMCIDHQIEQAEWEAMQAMDKVERLKKEKERSEQEIKKQSIMY